MGSENEPGTVAQGEETFDQDWGAALNGELAPPTGQSAGDNQDAERQPVANQPGQQAPAAAAAPDPAIPADLLQRAKEAGFDSLDEALRAARNFQSIRGQLPNLEETWKRQHLTPLERRLQAAEAREQQARDQFVLVNPYTGQARTPAEQAQIRAALDQEQGEQQAQEAQERQAEEARQAEQRRQLELTQREQSVREMEQGNLKLLAINSLTPFVQTLASNYGVPAADIQRYIDETGMIQRVQALDDMRRYGPMIEALEDHVRVRANQLQADNARRANADGRYRDVGSTGGGRGGQSGADRWTKANDQDFERAWERALRGELA